MPKARGITQTTARLAGDVSFGIRDAERHHAGSKDYRARNLAAGKAAAGWTPAPSPRDAGLSSWPFTETFLGAEQTRKGQLGREISVEQGKEEACVVMINALASIKAEIGKLSGAKARRPSLRNGELHAGL